MDLIVSANADDFSINGIKWKSAPKTEELCATLDVGEPADGDFVTIDGKRDSRFR